jgi:hypothetical protein
MHKIIIKINNFYEFFIKFFNEILFSVNAKLHKILETIFFK